MVKVYFEMNNGKYAELVAIFENEETYMACLPALEEQCKKNNFDLITESIEDRLSLSDADDIINQKLN